MKNDFFGLSEKEKREIVIQAVRDANAEQLKLIKKYNRSFNN